MWSYFVLGTSGKKEIYKRILSGERWEILHCVLYWDKCGERESWDIENILSLQLYSLHKREFLYVEGRCSFCGALDSSTNPELFESYDVVVGLLYPGGDKSEMYCWIGVDYAAVGLNLLKESEISAPQPKDDLFIFVYFIFNCNLL